MATDGNKELGAYGGHAGRPAGSPMTGADPAPGRPRATAGLDEQGCGLCALAARARGEAEPGEGTPAVVHLGDEIFGLVEPGQLGVIVAPTAHVPGFSTDPATSAVLLAALRRAAVTVQSSYDTSGTMIEPVTDAYRGTSHACYRIVPTLPLDVFRSTPRAAVDPGVLERNFTSDKRGRISG